MTISTVIYNIVQTSIFLLFLIFFVKKQNTFEKKIRQKLFAILFIQTVGLIFAILNSITNPPRYFIDDLVTLLNLMVAPFVAIISYHLLVKYKKIKIFIVNIFIIFGLYFLFGKLFSVQLPFLGSFLRSDSTAVAYSLIYIGFIGITLILEKKLLRRGYTLVLIAIVVGILTLAKWSIPAAIILSLLLVIIYKNSDEKRLSPTIKMLIAGTVLATFTIFLLQGGLDMIAQKSGFNNFYQFIYERIIHDSAKQQIGNSSYSTFIRDGGRFPMWQDIIERTFNSPFTGIGVGQRPIINDGPNTHNVWVFLFGNYGIPIFLICIMQLFLFYRFIYKNLPLDKKNRTTYLAWMLYLAFSFSVGASFDQSFNIFLAFLPLGYYVSVCKIHRKSIDSLPQRKQENRNSIKSTSPKIQTLELNNSI